MADDTPKLDADGKPIVEGEKAKPANADEVRLLGQAVSFLAQGFADLKKTNEGIAAALADMKPAEIKEVKKDISAAFKDMDLENMTEVQKLEVITKHINESVEAKVAERLKEVDSKTDKLADAFNSKNAAEQIEKLSKDNEDFFEYTAEIRAVLKEQPTLSVARAYVLAKAEADPKKVAEMTKKYAKTPEGKPRIYGLSPGARKGEGGGKMSQQEAAEKAFEDILGGIEGLVNNGTN